MYFVKNIMTNEDQTALYRTSHIEGLFIIN